MRFRPTLFAAMAIVTVVTTAAPAWAHEEITPKTFPTGQPTFLTLTAANEASADLVKIVLKAPAGLGFGEATRSPAGWSVAATDGTITWTGGAVKHDAFETWGFEIEGADQPGTLTYKVTLAYAGGKSDDVDVDVTVTAPASGGANPASPAGAATTATTAASASPTTAAAPAADSDSSSGGQSGTAKAALAVSILALLVAAGALAVGARRAGGPGSSQASGGGAGPGAAQDW